VGEFEETLVGGMDSGGSVVRVGDTVRRPIKRAGPAAAVRALLVHLEDVGFEEAPRFLGFDDQGREVLSFIDGQVPLPPFPEWSMTDSALVSVARLLCRFHDATASLDQGETDGWFTSWADPTGGNVVCHNDSCPQNVVFRAGEAVALIDFDLAAPGRRLWDVAGAAQVWCPLSAPQWRHHHPRDLDGVARLRLLARGYGVADEDSSLLVETIMRSRQQAMAHIRDQLAAGHPAWTDEWQRTDGERRAAADDAWLEQHRDALVEALRQ
jgi:Phosphotransferase enzyme family